MRTNTLTSCTIALALALAACGGAPAPTGPAPTAAPVEKPATDAQRKVAHFATADGMNGFTLDRSGTPIKLQVDGDKEIYELTQREHRDQRGELLGYHLVDPTNVVRITIGTSGAITFHKGKDELPATADKDAAPLGPPTVAGPPVEKKAPPAPYEKLAAELAAVSVRAKQPDMRPQDAADLAKIEAAIAKADASMFVRYKKPGPDGWVARSQAVPDQFSGIGYGGGDFSTDDEEANRHKGLIQNGVRQIGVSSPERDQGNHILNRRTDDKRDELANGTPGLVWEVDGSRVVFVTLDGGRYLVDLNQGSAKSVPIERGAGPESGWPAPLQDTYADITYVSSLAKAGVVPEAKSTELQAIDLEWNACVAKAWKPKRIQQNVNFRAEAIKVHQGCSKVLDKHARTLLSFIEERKAARKALHEKAVARVRAVGANK